MPSFDDQDGRSGFNQRLTTSNDLPTSIFLSVKYFQLISKQLETKLRALDLHQGMILPSSYHSLTLVDWAEIIGKLRNLNFESGQLLEQFLNALSQRSSFKTDSPTSPSSLEQKTLDE